MFPSFLGEKFTSGTASNFIILSLFIPLRALNTSFMYVSFIFRGKFTSGTASNGTGVVEDESGKVGVTKSGAVV